MDGVDHAFLYCLEYLTGRHFIHGQAVGLGHLSRVGTAGERAGGHAGDAPSHRRRHPARGDGRRVGGCRDAMRRAGLVRPLCRLLRLPSPTCSPSPTSCSNGRGSACTPRSDRGRPDGAGCPGRRLDREEERPWISALESGHLRGVATLIAILGLVAGACSSGGAHRQHAAAATPTAAAPRQRAGLGRREPARVRGHRARRDRQQGHDRRRDQGRDQGRGRADRRQLDVRGDRRDRQPVPERT